MTNKEFSKALGHALKRPAIAPIPAFAIRVLYGGMAKLVVEGQRALPAGRSSSATSSSILISTKRCSRRFARHE